MNGSRRADVSVIIPTYNYGHFLNECLASVYRQRDVNVEVIVVDDGSTDETREVLKPHLGRVKVIRQNNRGLPAARNAGLRASTGEYIQFLDADDILGNTSIAARVDALRRMNDQGIAVCRNRVFARVVFERVPVVKGWWMLFREHLETHLCRLNIAPPHSFLMPRDAVDKVGEFDETLKGCEDYDYWLRALGRYYPPVFCAEGRVYYRKHGTSMGSKKKRRRAFPFDILVQEKKHQNAYGDGVTKTLETLPGTLAYCDGLLTTAIKVDPVANPNGRNRLIELACIQLKVFVDQMPPSYQDLPDIAKLQLSRILAKNQRIRQLGEDALVQYLEVIKERFGIRQMVRTNLSLDAPFTSYEKKMAWYCAFKLVIQQSIP